MKRNLILMLTLLGATAAAQGVTAVTASIPFAFTVGQATLPAGRYWFEKQPGNNGNVLEVRSEDGRPIALALIAEASGGEAAKSTDLVFRKIAGQDFLESIEVAGMTERLNLAPPTSEKKAMHNVGIGKLFHHPAEHARS